MSNLRAFHWRAPGTTSHYEPNYYFTEYNSENFNLFTIAKRSKFYFFYYTIAKRSKFSTRALTFILETTMPEAGIVLLA